jgi:hypothetical protein
MLDGLEPRDWLDEAIPPSRHVRDITRAVATASQRATKVRYLHAHVGVFDNQSRPGDRDQLCGRQDFSIVLNHRSQHVEGATPQRDDSAVLPQDALPRVQAKWPERERVCHALLSDNCRELTSPRYPPGAGDGFATGG